MYMRGKGVGQEMLSASCCMTKSSPSVPLFLLTHSPMLVYEVSGPGEHSLPSLALLRSLSGTGSCCSSGKTCLPHKTCTTQRDRRGGSLNKYQVRVSSLVLSCRLPDPATSRWTPTLLCADKEFSVKQSARLQKENARYSGWGLELVGVRLSCICMKLSFRPGCFSTCSCCRHAHLPWQSHPAQTREAHSYAWPFSMASSDWVECIKAVT